MNPKHSAAWLGLHETQLSIYLGRRSAPRDDVIERIKAKLPRLSSPSISWEVKKYEPMMTREKFAEWIKSVPTSRISVALNGNTKNLYMYRSGRTAPSRLKYCVLQYHFPELRDYKHGMTKGKSTGKTQQKKVELKPLITFPTPGSDGLWIDSPQKPAPDFSEVQQDPLMTPELKQMVKDLVADEVRKLLRAV